MRANDLLLWLSARREGSWQQFRAGVEEICTDDSEDASAESSAEDVGEFPLHQQLRLDFERLAHVEFFASGCEDGWRVVPPTLAAQPTADGARAVLCGARSPSFSERMRRAASDSVCETLAPAGIPEVYRFTARDTATLAKMAEQAGLHFQPDAALAILSHLPPCDPPKATSELPVGSDWIIHEFDATALCWRKTDRRGANTARLGLFRFMHRFQRPTYFLRRGSQTSKLPRAVGLFIVLKRSRHRLLRYGASAQSLCLPAICRPPRLMERALVLCSGLPPTYDPATASLTYVDVPHDIARLAAELLRQPLT